LVVAVGVGEVAFCAVAGVVVIVTGFDLVAFDVGFDDG
jgi:hypothetical protein